MVRKANTINGGGKPRDLIGRLRVGDARVDERKQKSSLLRSEPGKRRELAWINAEYSTQSKPGLL